MEIETFKVGSLNILNQGDELKIRYRYVQEALKNDPVDVMMFQEIIDLDFLVELMGELGFRHYVSSVDEPTPEKLSSGDLAIFSKNPINVPKIVGSLKNHPDYRLLVGRTVVGDRTINLFTTHSYWGGENEGKRLDLVSDVERLAKVLENDVVGSLSVFSGDLNSDPDSRSVRFLTGKDLAADNKSGAFWVDSFELAESDVPWDTTDHGNNIYGRKTAASVGIKFPHILPKRRIDYIFIRGWVYGRIGSPIKYSILEHPEKKTLSDHSGIICEILLNVS